MTRWDERLKVAYTLPGWRAWAGLVVGPIVWGLHHQLGSNLSFAACDRHPQGIALIAGAIALLILIASAWLAWISWKDAGGTAAEEAEALEVFVPLLSIMAATIFGLTILVQLLADIILPPCFG
jgi:hypothetical protein